MKTILFITVLEVFVGTLLLALWRFRGANSRTPAAAFAPSIVPVAKNVSAEFVRRAAVDDSRWAFINSWKVAPQGDDRTPMHGDAAASSGSSSAGRSVARRRHQTKYKEWSQHRHD
jgi:hypothetical protein